MLVVVFKLHMPLKTVKKCPTERVKLKFLCNKIDMYRAFHIFGQAKYPDVGSILGSSASQFSILPQLPPKILLDSKVIKNNHFASLI